MPVRTEIHEGVVPVKVYTGEIEAAARQQLVNISRLPIVHHHVAAMPDVHLGIGATVGSVIPTVRAIIPAAVGVDIGCGMMATQLSLSGNELDENSLRKVFNQISRDVPVGYEQHNDRDVRDHAAKRFQKVANATAMIWRMLMVAESRFRRLRAPALVQEVHRGVQFENGVRVKHITREAAA